MAKGTGLVKSKARYLKLIEMYPDRADFYRSQIEKVEADIVKLQVCRRCGRPLKNEEARKIGYGKECQSQALAELEAHLSENKETNTVGINGLCANGEGHGSGVPGGEGLDETVLR